MGEFSATQRKNVSRISDYRLFYGNEFIALKMSKGSRLSVLEMEVPG